MIEHDQVLEELCQSLYNGDWHSFLAALQERRKSGKWASLPFKIKQNIERDIEIISKRLKL